MIEFLFIFVSGQVMFDAVGGLNKQIRALKEMVLFPLMYPEVFEKFKISPPRGVLFHGPPGMTVFFFFWFYKMYFIIYETRVQINLAPVFSCQVLLNARDLPITGNWGKCLACLITWFTIYIQLNAI